METYYREVEKLRDSAIQDGGCSRAHCKTVLQTVKALCATLYKIETADVIKSMAKLEKLAQQVSSLLLMVLGLMIEPCVTSYRVQYCNPGAFCELHFKAPDTDLFLY